VAIPKIAYCPERKRLLDAFLESIRELSDVQAQQIRAVIDGDPTFTKFDLPLHFAQEKKDRAKYAWITHVEEHGCHE